MLSRIAGFTIIAALLAGCAASGPKFNEVSASFPALGADQGRIYFYRTPFTFGGAVTAEIRLGNQAVGRSQRGSFFYVDRPPGNYEVTTTTEVEKKLTFALASGETKYVRTYVGFGLLVGRVIPELMNMKEAEMDMADLAHIGSTK